MSVNLFGTEDSGGGLSDIKDLEADDEFEMLALDGSASTTQCC
jgi:hypothetical protein